MLAEADRDSGESLLELLIALAIMSVAVVAVVGGLLTSILTSDLHRKQSTAGAAVRDYAETVEKYVAGTGYTACASPSAYAAGTVGYTGVPAGFAASAVAVRYWTGTAWTTGSCTDLGLQELTIQVASSDTRASERLVVVLRKPCGVSSTC